MVRYAELQACTNFSFLRGASHPFELVETAADLGLAGLGIADRNTLAGVVRAHLAAKTRGLPFRVGCRLDFADATPSVLCYPTDREAYGRLTRLLTLGKTRAKKGECLLYGPDLLAYAEGQMLLVVPPDEPDAAFEAGLARLASDFRGNVRLVASRPYGARDLKRLHRLDGIARRTGAPLIATNDVLHHAPERRPLQDVLTCIREKRTIFTAGRLLEANAERRLKPPGEMARLFAGRPEALERTLEVLERCRFSLDELKYEYPREPTPPGKTPIEHLADLARAGARARYPGGVPPGVRGRLEEELALIAELDIPQYFLTVHDVVRFAREQGILCQGRGSAANSVVCFCLGITAVDPTEHDLLFARFVSRERDEPPDIDVDFEHERREEVIQYVYRRYGRERAAICATVIHYRPRSAIRDVGKALGLSEDVTAALANTVWGSWGDGLPDDHLRKAGLDPDSPEIRRATDLASELLNFPRHLSQHVGGFVLTERRLDETVPLGNAAMADRTFLEWDKDDIDALGLMKVDVLALGMLSLLRRGFRMMCDEGVPLTDVADVPRDDPEVYRMLARADSVGVFQVESRAQMSMLPRLKPSCFYDLVIEVAIVRPGPIQGDMVHPYLRRRDGTEPVEFPAPAPEHGPPDELARVLGKTLGVPLFQEQAMRLAIEAAKFTPDEANGLRRAMATFRNNGTVGVYRDKFIRGMTDRGYDPDFAERCFRQIEGFGSYGFPESHAASFAKLVYASAWLKRWRPDVFLAAILNSQPMGFYQPAQLVRDAREHGVEVREVDAFLSDWDTRLEGEWPAAPFKPVRLGMSQVRGLAEIDARRVIAARATGATTLQGLLEAGAPRAALERLAEADAFRSAGLDRRAGLWAARGLDLKAATPETAPLLALMGARTEPSAALPSEALSEQTVEDYRMIGLSLKAHPVAFFREALSRRGVLTAAELRDPRLKNGRRVKTAGIVLIRQRPGTAKGVTFLTLEDETGAANLIVWRDRFQANRKVVMTAAFLLVEGVHQREGDVIHLIADRFVDLSHRLPVLRDPDAARLAPEVRAAEAGRMTRPRSFR